MFKYAVISIIFKFMYKYMQNKQINVIIYYVPILIIKLTYSSYKKKCFGI